MQAKPVGVLPDFSATCNCMVLCKYQYATSWSRISGYRLLCPEACSLPEWISAGQTAQTYAHLEGRVAVPRTVIATVKSCRIIVVLQARAALALRGAQVDSVIVEHGQVCCLPAPVCKHFGEQLLGPRHHHSSRPSKLPPAVHLGHFRMRKIAALVCTERAAGGS